MVQGENLNTIPPEILQEILCFLTPTELTDVCVLNRHMKASAQKLLYASINLSSDDTSLEHTLRLLTLDEDLGLVVRSAILKTVLGHQFMDQPWIQPSIFKNWPNLKSLKLIGHPFFRHSDRQLFQEVLEQKCKLLAQITFIPNTDLEIAGISNFLWGAQNTSVELKLLPTNLFNVRSVTHLSFGGTVIHTVNHPLQFIFEYHFPNLLSVELGSLSICHDLLWSQRSLTQFLNRNSTIQHLSLGKKKLANRATFFQLDEPLFQNPLSGLVPNFLPSLISFEGFPENVVVMARAHVPCLDHLHFLGLVSSDDDAQDIESMCEALSERGLPSIRQLSVELCCHAPIGHTHPNVTFFSHIRCMDVLAQLCPNATEVFAKFETHMHRNTLGKLFAQYTRLETLVLPLSSLMLERSPSALDYFSPIAHQCPALRYVRARRPGYSQTEDFVYTLCRNPEGFLVEVRSG